MPASTYLRGEWMKYGFTATAMGTRPTEWWVALHDDDPTAAGTANEISGSGYGRVEVTSDLQRTDSVVDNTAPITFATVITTGYDVLYASIWDDETAGNCLFYGALEVPKSLDVGDALVFATGEFVLDVA